MNARPNWLLVDEHRACELCTYRGDLVDGIRHCVCPQVVDLRRQPRGVPVATLRNREGSCGPEARHMDFPGLRR